MIERDRGRLHQGRLRVALPWLEASLDAAAAEGWSSERAPAAEWLVARARVSSAQDVPWREWLLAPVAAGREILARCPAGPSVRAAGTGRPPVGTWACARPVHLATAIEHLRFAQEDVDMQAGESMALLEDINRHLEGRGFTLHAQAGAADWTLECAEPIECSSVEPDLAAGRNVRDLMPAGRDGARVRSLVNEIQMLLHEHPVNLDRVARGSPAINTLWLWGFGRSEDMDTVHLPTLYTDDAWLSGIWRLHGAHIRSLDEFAAGGDIDANNAMVAASCPPRGGLSADGISGALARAERVCLAPALAALRSGAVRGVDVLLGGRTLLVESSARFRFWRRSKPLAEALA